MKNREVLINDITSHLFSGSRRVFLTGSGGVGKSHTINLINDISECIKTSTTGISAIIINGQTIHSLFRLGFSSNVEELRVNDEAFLKKIGADSIHILVGKLKKAIKRSKFIMFDEVSMMNHDLFDMIMYRLNIMGLTNHPMLFSGDFLQLSPVEGESIISHQTFVNTFKVFNLNKVYRTNDKNFVEVLNKIRMGTVDEQVAKFIKSAHPSNREPLVNPILLFPTNNQVDSHNFMKLHDIDSPMVSYDLEVITYLKTPPQSQLDKFIRNAKLSLQLDLKVGARVMCLRNLAELGVVNGDVGTVLALNDDKINIEFDRFEKPIDIERLEFDNIEYVENNDGVLEKNVLWSVQAFPLTVAYAITIHKSQGSSLDNLSIDSENIFAPSQLYVALSRGINPDNVELKYDWTKAGIASVFHNIRNVNQEAKHYYANLPDDAQYE